MKLPTKQFRSGNRAEVTIPEPVHVGSYSSIQVEWESFPPSSDDLREYNEEVWPDQIVPTVIRHLEEQTGVPHRATTIAPGLSAFIPTVPEAAE